MNNMNRKLHFPFLYLFIAVNLTLLSICKLYSAEPIKISQTAQLNGEIEGNVHIMGAKALNFNSTSAVKGNLYVVGNPQININGSPHYFVLST